MNLRGHGSRGVPFLWWVVELTAYWLKPYLCVLQAMRLFDPITDNCHRGPRCQELSYRGQIPLTYHFQQIHHGSCSGYWLPHSLQQPSFDGNACENKQIKHTTNLGATWNLAMAMCFDSQWILLLGVSQLVKNELNENSLIGGGHAWNAWWIQKPQQCKYKADITKLKCIVVNLQSSVCYDWEY